MVDQRLSMGANPGAVEVTLSVHDARGMQVEQSMWAATARAAGWNLGIERFDIDDGIASVGVRKQGTDILQDTACTLTFSEGSDTKSIMIDVTRAFAHLAGGPHRTRI